MLTRCLLNKSQMLQNVKYIKVKSMQQKKLQYKL